MGFFSIFKKNNINITKPTQQTELKPQIPDNHTSKKKKNTYIITFNVMIDGTLSGLYQMTSLPIIEINGQKQNTTGRTINCKAFPNPCAADILYSHEVLQEIMGEKMSATIIEYLDKTTGTPVIQVYPEGWYVFDEYEKDYMTHLNHASRRDLKHQLTIREQMINKYIARQQMR